MAKTEGGTTNNRRTKRCGRPKGDSDSRDDALQTLRESLGMLEWGFAAALSVVLLAATLVLYAVYNRFMADVGLYETFMLGFAVLVILAGVVFSIVSAFTPTSGQRHHIYSTPNGAAAGGGDEDGAAGYPV